MNSDIALKKPGDHENNTLPRGVRVMVVGERVIFVKRMLGRWGLVSGLEQERLTAKHVRSNASTSS